MTVSEWLIHLNGVLPRSHDWEDVTHWDSLNMCFPEHLRAASAYCKCRKCSQKIIAHYMSGSIDIKWIRADMILSSKGLLQGHDGILSCMDFIMIKALK